MNKINLSLMTILVLFYAGSVNATLIDRGAGLIYDDVLDVTWMQNANYYGTLNNFTDNGMTWVNAINWAGELSFYDEVRNTYWNDWRLPGTLDQEESAGWDTTGMSSELAYMYYVNLGYQANDDPDVLVHPHGYALPSSENYNPFYNIRYRGYWSETLSTLEGIHDGRAWFFHMHFGYQSTNSPTGDELGLWLVRDGDVQASVEGNDSVNVPEPSTLLLLGTGLLLSVRRHWFTSKRT